MVLNFRVACVALCLLTGLAAAEAKEALPDEALLQALQRGGLVIAFGQRDSTDAQADGCILPRADRAGIEQVGDAIRRLQIPIGLVVTSRLCPTREAAALAFGLAVATDDLMPPQAVGRMAAHLGGPVPPGENRVLMTQAEVLRAVSGLDSGDLAVGEAVVVTPQEDGSFRVLTRMSIDRWVALAGGTKVQRRADAA